MKYLCFVVFLAIVIAENHSEQRVEAASSDGFVSRKGVQFILNGKPFYANGFNAYWLTYEATDPTTRFKITYAFQNATSHGLTIACDSNMKKTLSEAEYLLTSAMSQNDAALQNRHMGQVQGQGKPAKPKETPTATSSLQDKTETAPLQDKTRATKEEAAIVSSADKKGKKVAACDNRRKQTGIKQSNDKPIIELSNQFTALDSLSRTWGFRDGAIYRALQTAPGSYDEQTFQGLDFVIAEAKRLGIKMIITFVNNYSDFGGRKQYVDWAKTKGQNVYSDDDFYTNPLLKQYYKNNVKTMVNRVNTYTKVAYKDEPAIMGWELMNEPQCRADPSGKTLMAWIEEMARYVKSVDSNHLLSTGLEGFYGDSSPQRKTTLNPGVANVLGTDFIANHNIDAIDFASIHSYPDLWFPNLDEKSRLDFLRKWLEGHIEDAQNILRKPLVIGEFGKPTNTPGYTQDQRDAVFKATFDIVYASAQKGGSATGAWFWHLISDGMNNFKDSLAIVLSDNSSTVNIISEESRKLGLIFGKEKLSRKIIN